MWDEEVVKPKMANFGKRDDWRLCADWLIRCQIIAQGHKVTLENAQVFDLAQILRDGVLICHLLNRLQMGSIDPKEFSQRPQMSQVDFIIITTDNNH